MNTIKRIIKLELSILFYTPVAWLILVVFAAYMGISYVNLIDETLDVVKQGIPNNDLTQTFFENGLLRFSKNLLFILIPLLTMGVFSKEKSGETIKLLYSSPIPIWQVVLGKYLAILIYGLFFVLILLACLISAQGVILDIQLPVVLSGLLGIYLLIMVYASVGVFMSTLTTYQAISAFYAIVFLKGMDLLVAPTLGFSAISSLVNWFAVTHHADNLISGYFRSGDVIYFFLIALFFITLCFFKLKRERQEKQEKRKSLFAFGVLGLSLFLLNSFLAKPAFTIYNDFTPSKLFSLSPEGSAIVKQLDNKEPIDIALYKDVSEYSVSENSKDRKYLDKLFQYLPNINLSYKSFYNDDYVGNTSFISNKFLDLPEREKIAILAKRAGISSNKVKDIRELSIKEDAKYFGNGVRTIAYKGLTKKLYNNMNPNYKNLLTKLKEFEQPRVKIGYVMGHNEPSVTISNLDSWSNIANEEFASSIVNLGFDIENLNLKNQNIADDIEILIIADAKSAFTALELEKLEHYINKGGNMFIASNPKNSTNLNPILSILGLQYMEGECIMAEGQSETSKGVFPYNKISETGYKRTGIKPIPNTPWYIQALPYTGIEVVSNNDFNSEPLIVTNGHVWLGTQEDAKRIPPVNIATTSLRKVGEKSQKIIVLSNASFLSNDYTFSSNDVGDRNYRFFMYVMRWLTDGRYPILLEKQSVVDGRFSMTNKRFRSIKLLFNWGIPIFLGVLGTVLLTVRRRR